MFYFWHKLIIILPYVCIHIQCFSCSAKIYFIYVYVNTYKCIYEYMYVYIWEYTNPFKLTFVWWVFSLGFRFVYVQEIKKYFCSKKWIVVIHIAEKCIKLYCIAKGVTAQQKDLPHNRRFYCTTKSFTAQQKVLLRNRKFYCTAKKSIMWQKLEKSSFCDRNRW